jgi:hypothetical protein
LPGLSEQHDLNLYFAPFFGGAASLHMVPASLQEGHFLGLQRVSTLLPHFSQVKTAIDTPPDDSRIIIEKIQGVKYT